MAREDHTNERSSHNWQRKVRNLFFCIIACLPRRIYSEMPDRKFSRSALLRVNLSVYIVDIFHAFEDWSVYLAEEEYNFRKITVKLSDIENI